MTITYTFNNRYDEEREFEYDASISDYYYGIGASLEDIIRDYEAAGAVAPERGEGETDEEYLDELYEDMRWNADLERFLYYDLKEYFSEAAYDAFMDSGEYDERPYPYCYY